MVDDSLHQHMQRLLQLSHELISTVSLERLLRRIVEAAAEMTAAESAGIMLYDPDSDGLRFVVATGYADQLVNIPVPLERSIAGAVFHSGQAEIVDDVNGDPRYFRLPEEITGFVGRSLLAVPLQFQDRRVGVLEVENKRGDGRFERQDADALSVLAAQATIAIENARLVEELQHQYIAAQQEIAERTRVEAELSKHRTHLEELVEARVAEIQQVNAQLAQEVVERQSIEAALRASEQRYRILADTTPLPVIVVDLDGVVLYANQRAAALFEVPWEQAVGQYMPDFYIDPQARAAYLDRLHEHGRVVDYEMWLETATGRKFWALVSASVTTLEGRPAIFAAFSDITERRTMEEELRRRAEQLEQANREAQEARRIAEEANRAKSTFLANMSHELRTPLNAILGFSDMLAEDTTLTESQRTDLRTIHRSGDLLLQLINDVLDMAKIETGRATAQLVEMDMYHLLEGLGELFRLRAADKGLSFTVELAPELPRYIVSDERKVRRILLSLLSNAVKFTGSGEVALRVWVEREEHGMGPPALVLACSVQDTGPGIAPEYHKVVFQPFVQPVQRSRSQEGTGLGLPISRQYAQLLGGSLTIFSTGVPGEGARLELRIPIKLSGGKADTVTASAARSRLAEAGLDQPAHRLLVVEDQPENRLLLEIMLRNLGFDVRTAQDGPEALRLWEEWQPHLVWMDLYMPEMDGYEVARRIRATPQGQSTIIVALTASVREEDRVRGFAVGCNDFLYKPFHKEDLVEVLVRHLGVRFRPEATLEERGFPATPVPATASPAPRQGLDLRDLPSDWIAMVQRAAIAADGATLTALAEEVRGERSDLATTLQALVAEFDYQTILMGTQEYLDG
jgi:PAS domain S-box-containing protein